MMDLTIRSSNRCGLWRLICAAGTGSVSAQVSVGDARNAMQLAVARIPMTIGTTHLMTLLMVTMTTS